jgi:Flp pilus assembly pilin Flp
VASREAPIRTGDSLRSGSVMLRKTFFWIVSHTPLDQRGQDLYEYAMLIGFIGLVVVGVVILLGNNFSLLLNAIASEVGP